VRQTAYAAYWHPRLELVKEGLGEFTFPSVKVSVDMENSSVFERNVFHLQRVDLSAIEKQVVCDPSGEHLLEARSEPRFVRVIFACVLALVIACGFLCPVLLFIAVYVFKAVLSTVTLVAVLLVVFSVTFLAGFLVF